MNMHKQFEVANIEIFPAKVAGIEMGNRMHANEAVENDEDEVYTQNSKQARDHQKNHVEYSPQIAISPQ